MSIQSLVQATPIVVSWLCRSAGWRLVWGQGPACDTQNRIIYLPHMAADDPNSVTLLSGFIDHETAHAQFTDPDFPKQPGLHGELRNALEDPRIEVLRGRQFPGCRTNLAETIRVMVEGGKGFSPLRSGDHPARVLTAYMCTALRAELCGQRALEPIVETNERVFLATFGRGLATRLQALMYQVRSAANTGEVHAITDRILALMKNELAEDPEDGSHPGPSAQSSGADQGSGAEGDSDGKSDGDTDGDSDGKPDGDAGGDTAGDSDPHKEAIRQALAAGDDDFDGSTDLGKLLSGEINESIGEAVRSQGAVVPASVVPLPDSSLGGAPDPQQVALAANALRTRLQGLLAAETLRHRRRVANGTRIDRRSLHRLYLNDPRIFRQERLHRTEDTAVLLLLDRSSSMARRIRLAADAVLATMQALEGMRGVASAAGAFPAGIRPDPKGVHVLTGFGQSLRETHPNYGITARGRTPLAGALWWCAAELLGRSEPRKLLLVATDGEPDSVDSAIQVLDGMAAAGIETVGIGIGTHAVSRVFSDSVVIHQVGELAGVLFGALQRRLIRAA